MQKITRRVGIGIVMITILLFLSGLENPQRSDSQTPELGVGKFANGALGPDETQVWQLTVSESGTLTVFANRTFGDLDVMLAVYDEAGEIIAENDDRQPGIIRDAAVSIEVSAQIAYTIEVMPFAGSGLYEIIALPAFDQIWADETFDADFTRWSSPYTTQNRQQLVLNNQQQGGRSVVVVPDGGLDHDQMYLHAVFDWQTQGATSVGLALRLQSIATLNPDGYYFNVTPTGRWEIVMRQFGTDEIMLDGESAPLSGAARIALGVRADSTALTFYANGQALGAIEDATFEDGRWGLHLLSDANAASVIFDRVLVSVPATPLPDFPIVLENWRSARPDDIAAELADAEIIPDGGRRVYTVLDTAYEVAPAITATYPQVEDGVRYDEMLLNIDVRLSDGLNVACGVSFHELGRENLKLAFVDRDGGAGLLHVVDGVVVRNAYNIVEPPDEPLTEDRQRLSIVTYGEYVTLYVNGRLFITQYAPARSGTLAVALINYATNSARCEFSNLWVWQ